MNEICNCFRNQKFSILNAIRNFSLSRHMKTIDKQVIKSIEQLALVDFSTETGISRLKKSIQFADNLMEVDTSSVEPMISTVYEINENIREDAVTEKSNREDLMKIASVTEEFYYVAPLGTFSRKQNDNPSSS